MLRHAEETIAVDPPGRGARPLRAAARLVGDSPAAQALEATVERVARCECSVLVTGETGSGKEAVARAIHAAGPRAGGPFVAVNCGALSLTLAESQLFGHERGAFTGAARASMGALRAADGGVLFLDEIGEMPLAMQPLLLRVLQEREVTPVGAARSLPIDVQVIAATNRDIAAAVEAGSFRRDLYYRINTVQLHVPPLRERPDDIAPFVAHFSRRLAARLGRDPWQPDADTLDRFRRHGWPGNVRELAQAVERAYVLGHGLAVSGEPAVAVAAGAGAAPTRDPVLPVLDLGTLRRIAVGQALAATDGHKGAAARLLGVSRNTMTRLVADACPERRPRRGRRAK